MSQRTDLQREILVTAYDNPKMSQSEIADKLGCSASYVSNVLNEYDSHDAMAARIEQFDAGFELMGQPANGDVRQAKPDFEGISVENTPPAGIAVMGVLVAAFLLSSRGLIAERPLIRWGMIIGSFGLFLGVAALFYQRIASEGLSSGIDWVLGNEQDTVEEESGTNSTERTQPAPQSLKDDLYFERAEKECEWCETRVDSPDVHHITPRSEGGANRSGNLIVLCPNCHRKADRGIIGRSKLERAIQGSIRK